MGRRLFAWVVLAWLTFSALVVVRPALAQGPAASSSVPIAPSAPSVPTATATFAKPDTPAERPVRGPAVRDRGARRPRAGGAASGVLFLLVIVGIMGYYVVKRLRRYR